MHSANTIEKRKAERINFIFPVRTCTGIDGETINFSRLGLLLALKEPLKSTRTIPLQIYLPFSETIETNIEVVRNIESLKNSRYLCGARFLRLRKNEEDILNEAINRYSSLDPEFALLTVNMRSWLIEFKSKCDKFDFQDAQSTAQTKFVEENYGGLKLVLDEFFKNIWIRAAYIKAEDYKFHEQYYWDMLGYILIDSVEICRFGRRKPFGYAGDFMLINYFYDYHTKYLGDSSYERLINYYTCNIPIATSVVERKDFFKKRILETIKRKGSAKILSVASGSARELTELLSEGKIDKPLYFDCLDVEPEAFINIRKTLDKIEEKNKKNLQLRFLQEDFLSIIKGRELRSLFSQYDFIYSSGLFDYLTDRMARRVIHYLFGLLNDDCCLMITNANNDDYHRAYYEMLDKWKLIHREDKDLLDWAEQIKESCLAKIIKMDTKEPFKFLILSVHKKIDT
jgi:hypothetical protein